MSRVWTVKTLTTELKRTFDRFFPNVVVEGEVAQLQVPRSGHCYLTLREGDATLAGVVWRSHWGATAFRPKVGDRVRCRGKIGLYPSQSKVQIYVRHLEPAGEGWLQKQIKERIERLRKEGLLDPARKRPLPSTPRTVGIATSADGAALQDFLRVSRERFRETYERVNGIFQELYPRLVGGGKARLGLTNEDDLLETGVEVFVQPPGKRLQSLTLLSGGETAMVAIALIFSLFRVKPSPFCLLDEVDAPLDEANGSRFNHMLAEMADLSQFIVITHNKKTMECVDTLYGVTMTTPGVSRLVTVSLDGDRPDTRAP